MNQQTRLIFVEGVSFTGKSTTSEYIATQLDLNGHPAHWVSEGMLLQRYFPHLSAVFEQQQTLSETTLRAEWSAFVEGVQAAAAIFVVDSALSYAIVSPLLMEDRPVAAIHAEFRRVAELCRPLQPRVIHLIGDVERLVPDSIAERGEAWRQHLIGQSDAAPYQQARGRSGVAGAISMLQDEQELLREALTHEGWQTLTLDVTDRAAHQRAMLSFLGLNEVLVDRPALARSVLESYVGTYATDDPDRRDKALSVQLEHETLILHASNQRYGALMPMSATRFHLQAAPVDIEFVVEDGLARSLTLHRSDGKMYSYRRI
jgi:hypothetical protein